MHNIKIFSLSLKIKNTFPQTISFPIEVAMMLDFIEKNNFLYFHTDILFYPMEQSIILDYFNNDKIGHFFGLLGTTGDGSIIAIWENEGKQYFIHLGSDGDNWLILASNPIDFIRVIAIGYDHFDREEVLNPPLNSRVDESFQNWVKKTFSVDIPDSGKDIIDLKSERLINWIES